MANNLVTTLTTQIKVCSAMWEYHYNNRVSRRSCLDNCLLNRLLCKYIERYDPDLSKALASAKNESNVYYLLLKKLCEFAPTTANNLELEELVNFCFPDAPPEETL